MNHAKYAILKYKDYFHNFSNSCDPIEGKFLKGPNVPLNMNLPKDVSYSLVMVCQERLFGLLFVEP